MKKYKVHVNYIFVGDTDFLPSLKASFECAKRPTTKKIMKLLASTQYCSHIKGNHLSIINNNNVKHIEVSIQEVEDD